GEVYGTVIPQHRHGALADGIGPIEFASFDQRERIKRCEELRSPVRRAPVADTFVQWNGALGATCSSVLRGLASRSQGTSGRYVKNCAEACSCSGQDRD